MQRSITIVLLLCLHSQPICNAYTFADFLLNQDYIKEFLCINKDRPKLECNGKCYLMQQLKQNEPEKEKESQLPHLKITKTEYIDFSNISYDISKKKVQFLKKQYAHYLLGTYPKVSREVFHPPQV